MKLKTLALAVLALPFSTATLAENTITKPAQIVSFNTEVEREIERDLLQVRLFYQVDGKNLSDLNKTISERLNKAVAIAKEQSAVEIKGNSRNTSVRNDAQGKKNGWIARAELVLESKDFQAISNLISTLDDVMAVEDINASISSEKLMSVENELTQAAIEKFKKKADLIQNSLKMKDYRILDLDISSVNEQMPIRAYGTARAAKVATLSADYAGADQAFLENGKETVRIRANARIELLKD
ncbi:SIMPL domain-containing protein [Rodentibacter haemolyticus]|uniref:SIMPL domain-containing protein n=1 Tax=Rodentibacter haemolyticus TaxID=2778911 RepID=A0ABX6UUM5_9PAST|nr:SIMPL domain-containing protein [Rodentibacter haemolyticus]QPB41693.1 SIMPL domain-containing protein [Rodentibacter haemolyticus]